ncbi:MAG TPA: hypothetical protein VJ773_02190 [Gemmatimonadales bacterium]|nr:hypothetical protein [Gemmatimonadales bacterium]
MRSLVRSFPLLAAAFLWACSDEDGGTNPPDPDEGLPEFAAGDQQLSPALRAEVLAMVAEVADAAGVDADPELAGVVGAIAAGFTGDGWISGVDASSASLMVGNPELRLASGTWGVFAAGVAVYPNDQDPVTAYYTAIVALRGTEVAIGVRKAVTEQQLSTMRSDFPDPIARGLLFQGASKGWEALTGYVQVIGLKTITGGCSGTMPAGVSCQYGTSSAGLEITASTPVPFNGNLAGGSRQFLLDYGDVRGYAFDVLCDAASFC